MIPSLESFRQATIKDAMAIAAVKEAVWPEESADMEVITNALESPTHHAHLAFIGGQLAGFVSCFVTESARGEERWEVDLLAVHPNYRRRGLATKLIGIAVEKGRGQSCDFARALIQIDNSGSQRSFARNGFTTDGQLHTLFVCTEEVGAEGVGAEEVGAEAAALSIAPINDADGVHMVFVNTLGYRGIWLEGTLSADAVTLARANFASTDASVVGVIIPNKDKENCSHAQANQYHPVGQFHHWIRDY